MRVAPISRYFGIYTSASTAPVEPTTSVAKVQLNPENPSKDAVVLAQSLLELIEQRKHEKQN